MPDDATRPPAATPLKPRPSAVARRLPLLGVFVAVLASLSYLDHLLQREYRAGATTQAVQTDALLEGAIAHRMTLLHALDLLITRAVSPQDAHERFTVFAQELVGSAPDVVAVYRLGPDRLIRDVMPRSVAPAGWTPASAVRLADPSEAPNRAWESGHAATSQIMVLPTGVRGVLIYDPLMVDARVEGAVVLAISQRSLLENALAAQTRGQFAFRITDDAGNVIDVSPGYPARVASLVHREVTLPGDRAWGLDVAIEPFQPVTARLTMWVTGLLLVALVVLLVVREDARAERLASHSLKLELLTRNLLDANVRLEDRAQQIAEANRAKSRFLANVSHELRTPLNAIMGYNSLALSGLYDNSPAERTTAHERIRAASEHLLTLVDEILDLSRIEVGRMDVDFQPVDVRALIAGVVGTLEPIAAAKGLRLDVAVDQGLPSLLTDPRHVRKILVNLATNAIKFTERGAVTVAARAKPETAEWCLMVEDTGIGIGADDQERIFEEFEQVRPEGRGDSAERGTGLGLSVSRKLARLLGGDITVESRLGVGSRFTVALPFRPAGTADETAPATTPAEPVAEPPRAPAPGTRRHTDDAHEHSEAHSRAPGPPTSASHDADVDSAGATIVTGGDAGSTRSTRGLDDRGGEG